jgi:hypothetical protein
MAAPSFYQSGVKEQTILAGTELVEIDNGGAVKVVVPASAFANVPSGLITVAAAGASLGTATAIPAGAQIVNVTTTTSAEGVKLPTAGTGRRVTLLTPTTKGYKVYGAAAGQLINAATTATTAYAMTTLHPATFIGLNATHWRVLRGN